MLDPLQIISSDVTVHISKTGRAQSADCQTVSQTTQLSHRQKDTHLLTDVLCKSEDAFSHL